MASLKKGYICIVFLFIGQLILSGCGKSSETAINENDLQSSEMEILKSVSEEETKSYKVESSVFDMDSCKEYIDKIQNIVGIYSERNYKMPGDVKSAVDDVYKIAEEWEGEGVAKLVTRHDNYVYIEFENGINYIFHPALSETSAVGNDVQVSVLSIQTFKTEFAGRGQETEIADYNATDGAAEKIVNTYDNYIWKENLDDKDITLQSVVDIFSSNEVILWNGHGGYFEECGPVLVLSQTIYDKKYTGDSVYWVMNEGNYLITADFINNYVGDMSNSFVYLSTCSGLRDSRLCDALAAKGVEAIVANTDVITTIYTSNIMASVIDKLLAGNNLETAMSMAKEIYGKKDSYLYTEDGALDYAVPTIYCGNDYMFEKLEVHMFEDGSYSTDREFDAEISDDLAALSIDTSFGHYNENWNYITDYEKSLYTIPISSECIVRIMEAETYTYSLNEKIDFVKKWVEVGNGMGFSIAIENGEIVEFIFSS